MLRRDILKGFAAAAGLALAAHAEDAAVKPDKGIANMPMIRTADGTDFFVPGCAFKVYEGAPRRLMLTHMDRLNAGLQDFIGRA